MVPVALHQFRQNGAARTRFRPQCRPAIAAMSDWLRPQHQRPAPGSAPAQTATPKPGPAAPTQIPPEYRGIVTNNPGIPNTPTVWNGERPPYPWEMEMSHVEWVVINKLGRKFPEAWRYLVDEALKRGGFSHIKDMEPKP